MRVAWVTPDFPPDRGGVSDHSNEMVNVLRAAGHEVLVCSRPHEKGFANLDAALAIFAPDLVVVAYTPLGYAPRAGGIAPAFARWCAGLRQRHQCRAILLAHEASLPAAYLWKKREFKLAALGVAQVAQFSFLSTCFDSVLFSNIGTLREWQRRLPRLAARFHALRICSNIPYHPSDSPLLELAARGYSVPEPTILFFGTGHQSVLFECVERAFSALLAVAPNAGLVVVGMTPDKLYQVHPSFARRRTRVRALGYVAPEAVSLWLQVATLVLAPLVEGVSARKGTVMAALQHGRAVVTTSGVHTLEDIAWSEICCLAPREPKPFADVVLEAFLDPERRTQVGSAARAEYAANASAEVTASQILGYASHPTRGKRL